MKTFTAEPACLYAMKAGPFFKLGWTANLVARLQVAQVNCPLEVSVAFYICTTRRVAPKAEYLAKQRLAEFNHRAEWYKAKIWIIRAEVLRAIEETELRIYPGINWFENGRPVYDRAAMPV